MHQKTMALSLLLGFVSSTASACIIPGPVKPESLVEQADAIYHVRAVGYVVPLRKRQQGEPPRIRFDLITSLKGALPNGPLIFAGVLVNADDPNGYPVPYFSVRPAGHGLCFATEYRMGAEYLLLVKAGTPYWSKLAPTNEQVFGPQDPWLEWVKQRTSRVRPNNSFKPKPLRGSA